MSNTGHRPPPALARSPATHTFSPQSTKYIFKKPQHNQASCKGPGEARIWPVGAEDGALGAEGTGGTGEPLWVLSSGVRCLFSSCEVPCSYGRGLTAPPPRTAKGRLVWPCPVCMSESLGEAPARGMLSMWGCPQSLSFVGEEFGGHPPSLGSLSLISAQAKVSSKVPQQRPQGGISKELEINKVPGGPAWIGP